MVAESHHCDMYWFPHTDRMLTKRNTRLDADVSEAVARRATPRLGRRRAALQLGLRRPDRGGQPGSRRDPADEPGLGRVLSRHAPTATSPTGSSPRRGGSSSARWSTPSRARPGSTRCARRGASSRASDWRISFPVEIRVAPADDIALSTAYGRDSFYLAFHTHHRSDWRTHAAYLEAMEAIMRDHDGRPHWGKLHTRTAADLAPAYPRFGDFLALRDRLDPDRLFANDYLRAGARRLTGPSTRQVTPVRDAGGAPCGQPGGRRRAGVGSAAPEQERAGARRERQRPWCTSGSPG